MHEAGWSRGVKSQGKDLEEWKQKVEERWARPEERARFTRSFPNQWDQGNMEQKDKVEATEESKNWKQWGYQERSYKQDSGQGRTWQASSQEEELEP